MEYDEPKISRLGWTWTPNAPDGSQFALVESTNPSSFVALRADRRSLSGAARGLQSRFSAADAE